MPPAAQFFALSYAGFPTGRIRTLARLLYLFQVIPVALIATDELHHLIRASAEIYYGPMGSATLAVILLFFLRVSPSMRSQIGSVVLRIAAPLIFAAFRVAFGEAFAFGAPISSAFALGCALLLYGVYKQNFLSLEPIARDQAFDVVDEGIVIRSRDGKVVDINRAGGWMLAPHLSLEDSEDASLKGKADAFLTEHLGALLGGDEPGGGKAPRHFNVKANWLNNAIGTRIGSVLVLRDTTREEQLVEHLKRRVQRDGLTGLYNCEALAELFESLSPLRQGPACLLIFDIDASLNDVIARADKALYRAKSEGKDRSAWEGPSGGRSAESRD